jgi:hypothetical protein
MEAVTPQITNSIPCPPPAKRGRIPGASSMYPVEQLEIGESFGVPKNKRSSLQGTAYRITKKTGRKYTIRAEDSEARIWRVS